MRNFNKKMLISILTSVVVLITIVATTFAWVGIFTYANTDNFDFNLRVSELDVNYFLQISATGEEGSFGDEADSIEIKRQIVRLTRKEIIEEIPEPQTPVITTTATVPAAPVVTIPNVSNSNYGIQGETLQLFGRLF